VSAAAETIAADTGEVLNAEEVAVFLRVDRKTVYDYANRGAIPHRRLGKRLLFSRSALVAWLADSPARAGQQQRPRISHE
jgi:excisionase family DNA binding protein